MCYNKKTEAETKAFIHEAKMIFMHWLRNCPEILEGLNSAIRLDSEMRELLEGETLLTDNERGMLKKWQSKLNH
ncbi:MAG: hypothetical protein GY774_04905 [Planctomycetes bacterium]|nr:hypothetical protein [Planctomycetota bacterium]